MRSAVTFLEAWEFPLSFQYFLSVLVFIIARFVDLCKALKKWNFPKIQKKTYNFSYILLTFQI
ncbi:hypothetical protein RUMCAL_03041 [Ruminococcus callidus ATCC 27760]|uniref:Uncharacterized protein n=1 Tax=Ruminococcus callidus ATCC 27760 TaxID=411473 RepID=U2LHS6_9FIRM|nr:hypothetical protein RUMCAL_03041 [Ruminococcus callidus ATCC 27760]